MKELPLILDARTLGAIKEIISLQLSKYAGDNSISTAFADIALRELRGKLEEVLRQNYDKRHGAYLLKVGEGARELWQNSQK